MWDEKMPKLVAYLEDKLSPAKVKDWDPQSWEELVVRLLSETLKIANDDDWAIALGDAFSSQIELYASSSPYLRSLAIKQLGVVIQRNSSKDFVRSKMEFLFNVTHHNDELESNGCASAVGYCSATHLDIVLEKVVSSARRLSQATLMMLKQRILSSLLTVRLLHMPTHL